ncbi:Gfo/Idh/MocA family oxidoreductase [Alicyclobacillus fastidiosus]|uniref:Gfo/Idh/MocA family oxidoreductase n=1 Tax=Alicyclobacillus fastidiosus TaxID=392011 RepID=A0ABY6ZF82_9BACL|nr:Gfo/Idh/MocA family oxidoreductase [Alicyclobacillus fastidiosus]WAH41503.1 Gfo/Idh/MocA family oxidoreductase [Alicyclobacillus fastidiosus]GMA63151.1 oxidoreductase [Alicyclobacillus fastidiosus]
MTIKVGVIGVGSIAEIAHLPNYQKNENVSLAAVMDFNEQRARQVANRFGVPAVYTDVDQMFANEQLDAVSICTPNTTHVPLALTAIQHGVDVLLEKPLSTDYIEAQMLVGEVEKAGRICMIGMPHRFRNEARALKHLVDSDALGDVYYVKAKILRRRGTPTGWFTDSSKSGGGSLMDIGVHVLDLAWWMTGMQQPERVSGQLVQGIGKYGTMMTGRWRSADAANQDNSVFDVEDFATAYIRFAGGMVLSLEVSWALNGQQDEAVKVDVYGTKGGLSIDPLCFYGEQNRLFTEGKIDIVPNDFYADEINHFVDCVKNRETPLIPALQGAQVVQILSAINRSSEMRQEIDVRDMETVTP